MEVKAVIMPMIVIAAGVLVFLLFRIYQDGYPDPKYYETYV